MNRLPVDATAEQTPDAPRPGRKALPRRARIYLTFVGLVYAALTGPLYLRLVSGYESDNWITFGVLGAAAAVSQIFVVRFSQRNLSHHLSVVFLVASALLLPPELIILVTILQHIPEWVKERYIWYIQVSNIWSYTFGTLAGWAAARAVFALDALAHENVRFALAGLAASAAFILVNHGVVASMLRVARGHRVRDTELFSGDSISTVFVLTALGVAVAYFWRTNPWLIPLALSPLFVLQRSLSVPQLQAEARVDPKTGLINARHFNTVLVEELGRAQRFERPMAVLMSDIDLFRDFNNTYGHLAGDAVLRAIADVFREQLRHYDVPSRFGGEEFCVLLPETTAEQALEIAERIRAAVASRHFEVETSSEPLKATVSIGVAEFPTDATDITALIHQADLAVYRAKIGGRNRVVAAGAEAEEQPEATAGDEPETAAARYPIAAAAQGPAAGGEDESAVARHPIAAVPPVEPLPRTLPGADVASAPVPAPAPAATPAPEEARRAERPRSLPGPRFVALSPTLATLILTIGLGGIAAGVLGALFGGSTDFLGLIAIVALVGVVQALALEVDHGGSLSVSAVGALAGAAIFGPRAALAIAVAICAVEWSARRPPLHETFFNIGILTGSSLTAAFVYRVGHEVVVTAAVAVGVPLSAPLAAVAMAASGLAAGAAYFGVNMGLVSLASTLEGHERWWKVFRERFAWLLPHYVAYGFIAGTMWIGYEAAGLTALAVFALPLLLMRKTMESYLAHTQRSAQKLREAAETIQKQNVSLERANKLLRERTTAAMESLSATVDARDSYTAGHSRRVQRIALAIGGEMDLSQADLDLLGHAALFHDIGKLAVPDAILLKPASLTKDEWHTMQRHAEEGARIIDRLGFLADAVPAIRHHHERFDGSGYPDKLEGHDIPLGARIIHLADALDSMLTTRIYRAARPAHEAYDEVVDGSGTQFCPRCVEAFQRVFAPEDLEEMSDAARVTLRAVS